MWAAGDGTCLADKSYLVGEKNKCLIELVHFYCWLLDNMLALNKVVNLTTVIILDRICNKKVDPIWFTFIVFDTLHFLTVI